ncbi:MAG: hypothetical protein QXN68_02635 [Thermoplasmata archaeon]
MKVFEKFIEIFNELIINPQAFKIFNEFQKQILDPDDNNIFHYLVFSENKELIKKIFEFQREKDFQTIKKIITEKNRFGETAKDWALSIMDQGLREEMYSLLNIQEPRQSYFPYDRFHEDMAPTSFNFTCNFLLITDTHRHNLHLSDKNLEDKVRKDYLGSIYGKNLLKVNLQKVLIPSELLFYFYETQASTLLKGVSLEPRFKRAYLHLYHFFSDVAFTVEEAKEKLASMKEDVSNVNLIVKKLTDSNLIVKIGRERDNETKNEKKFLGRPKSLYRLKEFYVRTDECAKRIEEKIRENSRLIGHYLTSLRALNQWIINELSEKEYFTVMLAILEGYIKVFKNIKMIPELTIYDYIYDYRETKRKRGRKRENTDIYFWIKSVSNFSQRVFRKILDSGTYISDEHFLSLIIELLQERARILGNAMSYELKGFLARVISDGLQKIESEQSLQSQQKEINLIVPLIDSDMTFLAVLLFLNKLGINVNLYLRMENFDSHIFLSKLFDKLNVKWKKFDKVDDLYNVYYKPKNNVFLINITQEQISKEEADIVSDIFNTFDKDKSLSVITIPKIGENEMINLYSEKYVRSERLVDEISRLLKKNQLGGLRLDKISTFIKLRDSSSSGSQMNYGILILDNNGNFEKPIYFTEEIENYTFRLSWLRETLKNRQLGFILEYPRDYLNRGNRLVWIV